MSYQNIYVPIDGSPLSDDAVALSVLIAGRCGADVTGSHVYAAALHDRRFRTMEGGLPEKYRREHELERQRATHDSLITRGLELISDSYLQAMAEKCIEHGVNHHGVSLEGRNWQELVKDIDAGDYDLVVMGGHGLGRSDYSQLGSVTRRVLRRIRCDMLVCKDETTGNTEDTIIVCLDGCPRSWGSLRRGIDLAKSLKKKLVALSIFDPHFHYAIFDTISKLLTDEARTVFNFEQQEHLHESIIDSGLARIYQSHLRIAERVCADEGVDIETHLLDGKAHVKILDYVRAHPPWLLMMGRIGIHSDEDMDIGGSTENVCHLAACNVMIVDTAATVPIETQAEETITWTKEAEERMTVVPAMARGVAMQAVHNYCVQKGHTVVTSAIVDAAKQELFKKPLPNLEKRVKQAHFGAKPQQGTDNHQINKAEKVVWTDDGVKRLQKVPEGFMRRAARKSIEEFATERDISDITLEVAESGLEGARRSMAASTGHPAPTDSYQVDCDPQQGRPQDLSPGSYECSMCGYVVDGERPPVCPACQHCDFQKLTDQERTAKPKTASMRLEWDEEALALMERIPPGFIRDMTRGRIEYWARNHSHARITTLVVQDKYNSWRDGTEPSQMELEWNDDARKRAERIPGFVRSMVIKEVENHVRFNGGTSVDGNALDQAMAGWKLQQVFHAESDSSDSQELP